MMTVIVGRGNRRAVGTVPDRRDRTVSAERDRESLKNFITRPALFAAQQKEKQS